MSQDQSRSYKTTDYRLVINLYRSYRIQIMVSSESAENSNPMRGRLLETFRGTRPILWPISPVGAGE